MRTDKDPIMLPIGRYEVKPIPLADKPWETIDRPGP